MSPKADPSKASNCGWLSVLLNPYGVPFFQSTFCHPIYLIQLASRKALLTKSMASYKQLACLQIVGINNLRLLNPDCMSQLVRKLKDPSNQWSSTLLFVGQQAKNLALQELFSDNNFKKYFCNSMATLQINNTSTYSDHFIFFVKSSLSQAILLITEDPHVCEIKSFLIQWTKNTTVQHLYNILHICLFCFFINVVCMFVNDFVNFKHAVQLLKSWTVTDSTSVHFDKIWSRVIIVKHKDAVSSTFIYDLLRIDNLQQSLHSRSLNEFFSSIKVLYLATEQLSFLTYFWQFKKLLWRKMNKMHQMWQDFSCLYSAKHITQFFAWLWPTWQPQWVGHLILYWWVRETTTLSQILFITCSDSCSLKEIIRFCTTH